ncbi:MAG: CAP domain-containing protein [Halocynthiibacter sp.]
MAQGQSNAGEVMAMWMESRLHRRNNLLPNVREFGIGYSAARKSWVLVLANPGC